ncbi:MAG: hypothetical protein RIT32_640 [Actinomycetota bacterium]|jgi:hypothetical protein
MLTWLGSLRQWRIKNWVVAAIGSIATVVIIGIPTAMIANPIFGRTVAVTDWSWPVLIVTAVLAGLLIGSYVAIDPMATGERELKFGTAGGILGFLAVGCPVCNKLVLIALGSSGAMTYFAPVQPYLGIAGIAFLLYAVRTRLQNQTGCKLPTQHSKIKATTE